MLCYKKDYSICYKLHIILFVLSYVFTFSFAPLIVHAERHKATKKVISLSKAQKPPFATKIYRTKPKDSLQILSKRYNITVNGIKWLNPKIKFKYNKTRLPAKTRLILPKRRLTALVSKKFSKMIMAKKAILSESNSLNVKADTAINSKASQAKSLMTRLASTIASSDNDTQKSTASNVSAVLADEASTQVNEKISAWLDQYGTVRLNLNITDKFQLNNSALDVLFPVYDKNNILLFTQGSFGHSNDQTLVNVGFGGRYFLEKSMFGVNSFVDYDFSGQHARMGAGAEYWRNYLKLAMNGYFALSDWQDSALEDYQARPANGFDIAAQAYLPTYPQLGFDVRFEKYFGDVALFNKEKRSLNASAYSVGINYTPIPLVTLSVDHKRGGSSEALTHFGLNLNYHFGVPFSKQIDHDNVDSLRQLSGSRYDFVSRNKEIVLNYKEKEATLPDKVSEDLSAIYPKKVNVAYDQEKDFVIYLRDEKGLSVDLLPEELNNVLKLFLQAEDPVKASKSTELDKAVLTPLEKIGEGSYKATLKAGKETEDLYIVASYHDQKFSKAFVRVYNNELDGDKSIFGVTITASEDDDNESAVFTFNAKNVDNHDLSDIPDQIVIKVKKDDEDIEILPMVETKVLGEYVSQYPIEQNHKYTFMPSIKVCSTDEQWVDLVDKKYELNNIQREINKENSEFSINKESIPTISNFPDENKVILSFKARDMNNKFISGLLKDISFIVKTASSNEEERIKVASAKDGIYTAYFTSKIENNYRVPGVYTISLKVKGEDSVFEEKQITIDPNLANPDGDKTIFKNSKKTLLLASLGGIVGEACISPYDALGNKQDLSKKKMRLVLKDIDGIIKDDAGEITLIEEKPEEAIYQISALQKGHYFLTLQYKGTNGAYRDLKKHDIYFIDAMPSELSKISSIDPIIAVNDSANYKTSTEIVFEAYDIYGDPIDFNILESFGEQKDKKLEMFFTKDGYTFSNSYFLSHDEGNKYKIKIGPKIMKELKLPGVYNFYVSYNGNRIHTALGSIEFSPDHSFPEKALATVSKEHISLENKDTADITFSYYTKENYSQDGIGKLNRISYRIFKNDQLVEESSNDFVIEKSEFVKNTQNIRFIPKLEGVYKIKAYYKSYGENEELLEIPDYAEITVGK